jgi:hypothetical protein
MMAKLERASVLYTVWRRHIMSHWGRPAGPRATPEDCRPQWPKGGAGCNVERAGRGPVFCTRALLRLPESESLTDSGPSLWH